MIQDLVASIMKETGIKSLEFMKVDISIEQDLISAWNKVISKNGRVNILVNNAARALGKTFLELSVQTFRKTIDINFMSIVQLTKLFLD